MDTPELPPASTPPETPPPEPNFGQVPSFSPQSQPVPFSAGSFSPAPPQYYGSPPMMPPAPSRSFMDIWKIVWTQPDVNAYRDVLRDTDTSLTRALTWVAGAWGVQLLVSMVLAAVFGLSALSEMRGGRLGNNSGDVQLATGGGSLLCTLIICLPVLIVVGLIFYLLFAVGVPHVVAIMFGGKGTFEQTAFLYAAITAPSTLIGILNNFVPHFLPLQCLVGIGALMIALYAIYLQVVAIKSVHDLGWGASVVSALSLFLLIMVFVCGCFALAFAGAAGSQS